MRNRDHEDVENMVRRFRLIDGEFRRLAVTYPNTVVINRDSKEFHERQGLVDIITLAGLPMFPEIPYQREPSVRGSARSAFRLAPSAGMAESIPVSVQPLSQRMEVLAALEPSPFPFISLYLNLTPDQNGREGSSTSSSRRCLTNAPRRFRRSRRSARASTSDAEADPANTSRPRTTRRHRGWRSSRAPARTSSRRFLLDSAGRRALAVHRLGAASLPAGAAR